MEDYIRIAHIENEVEGALLDSILTERGIDHVITNHHSSVFDGLIDQGIGWGTVEGPADRREEVIEVLEGLRAEAAANPADNDVS